MDTLTKSDLIRSQEFSDLWPFPSKNNESENLTNNSRLHLKSQESMNDLNYFEINISNKNNAFGQEDFHIILKISNEFVIELLKNYSIDNCLCNYSIFEKTVDIYEYMNFLKNIQKKITLSDYFDCFNKISILSLDVPFIEENGSVTYNFFNPTLSSMVLTVKNVGMKKIIFIII